MGAKGRESGRAGTLGMKQQQPYIHHWARLFECEREFTGAEPEFENYGPSSPYFLNKLQNKAILDIFILLCTLLPVYSKAPSTAEDTTLHRSKEYRG